MVRPPRWAGLSDRGQVRERNEDCWSADADLGLFIVSDGMGGRPAGEVASEVVVAALPTLVAHHFSAEPDLAAPDAPQRLRTVLTELSAEVREGSQDTPRLAGMGATAVAALVSASQATALIAHVGDSRAYLLRERSLHRLTRDHSLAQALIDAGAITDQQAAGHPARGQLTRHMGMAGEVSPDARRVALQPDDRLLLCSDGLTGMLDDAQIQAILNRSSDPQHACRALTEAANDAGGIDNITVLVIAPA
ncbi:MAG TPA: PP2C family serine/threonine-protein phosphatase [Pseudonocardiaceae bacterium]|nr:PP2C family serine/threonine-protein phosphatase [Pseudonocardiaceae bacterium]